MNEVYWSNTFEDCQFKIRIRIGQEQANAVQQYQAIALVLSKAFGGEKKNDLPKAVQSEEELAEAFKNMFGAGTVR